MDLQRIEGTFKAPKDPVSIIGCGAIGSQTALQLVKLGCENFILYDFDKVEPHNFVNQAFRMEQIGMLKTEATKQLIQEINNHAKVTTYSEDLLKKEEKLEGYIFMGPDTVSARKHCLTKNKTNPKILGWFDCRTEMFAIQAFSAKHTAAEISELLETLNFTDEEAEAAIPRAESGCHAKQASGVTSAIGGAALGKLFIEFVKEKTTRKFSRIDLDNWFIESYINQ